MYSRMTGPECYRRSAGFKHAIRESGMYDYWQARSYPEMCRPLDNDDFECGHAPTGGARTEGRSPHAPG